MLQRTVKNYFRRRSFRCKVLLYISGIVLIFFLLTIVLNVICFIPGVYNNVSGPPKDSENHPILIWWTPFTGDSGSYKQCGKDICFFTDQRKYFTDPRTKAFLFYGSDFKPTDLPIPRSPYHEWALLHEESPKNNFLFSMEKVMELFNHTSTFRQESDLPLTFQYLSSLEYLTSKKYFLPTEVKNEKGKKLAPVVFLHSDCNTPSERDFYVGELSKHIPVDSYGKCLQNKELPSSLTDPASTMSSPALFEILAQYKFSLALENAACKDYITEKLWRPLHLGSVPIYFGSPNIQDWLPNPESAILLKEFGSPKALADYLLALLSNDTAYEKHLDHKTKGKISNKNLIDSLSNRKWGIDNDPNKPSFIDSFECLVCNRVAENHRRSLRSVPPLKYQATLQHYGCPKPVGNFTLKPDDLGWWPELYDKALFESKAMENLMNRGSNFTATDFYQEVINLLERSAFT